VGYAFGLNLDEHRAEIEFAYLQGESVTSLAQRFGCSTTSLSRALARWRLRQKRDGRRKLADSDEMDICQRYAARESPPAIARALNIAPVTVREIVRRRGFDIRPRGGEFTTPPEVVARIIELNEQGYSQSQIAPQVGVNQRHVGRLLRHHGIKPHYSFRTGEQHHSWRGGRALDGNGYVLVRMDRNDPLYETMAKRSGYAAEHRLVVARFLGRPLTQQESVHHINGIKSDNRLENLQLFHGRQPKGFAMVCADCGSHNVIATEIDDGNPF
jgi:transposase-like protein